MKSSDNEMSVNELKDKLSHLLEESKRFQSEEMWFLAFTLRFFTSPSKPDTNIVVKLF